MNTVVADDLETFDQWVEYIQNRGIVYNSWEEVTNDNYLDNFPGKIALDENGRLILMPKPSPQHINLQGHFQTLLKAYMDALGYKGFCPPEPPVGNSLTPKTHEPDAVWVSKERNILFLNNPNKVYLPAPEICVEVLSPSNQRDNWTEILEKKQFYFNADAQEVWICDQEGKIDFYEKNQPNLKLQNSILIPHFPKIIPSDFDEVDQLIKAPSLKRQF